MKPPLRLIHIAGRFRAKTPWDVEQNIRRAEPAPIPDLRTAIEAAMHEWAVLPRWRRVELEREQQAQFVYGRLLAREWLVDIEQVREMIK